MAVAVAVAQEAGDVVFVLIVNSRSKRSTSDDHPAKGSVSGCKDQGLLSFQRGNAKANCRCSAAAEKQ